MEFIFIVGIIIAIVGVLTIFATLRQGDAPLAPPPGATAASATPLKAEAVRATSAHPTQPLPENDAVSAVEAALREVTEPAPPPIEDSDAPSIETITSIYAHANDDVAVGDTSLQINVANLLAVQIEQLYAEYVKLDEERSHLAEALFSRMLLDKIEKSAGRLEVASERETLDLRERFGKVSADYNRVQFRLGSLQHLNLRLGDPRVGQQMEELVLEIRRLASKS